MIDTNTAITIENITKIYKVHHEKPTLVENIFRKGSRKEFFTALDNISFSIGKGERVGIIGHNGAGKTTLLKVIAGITTPSAGEIKTNGTVVSLIDLTAGFHPDLTGEENIYLNGLIIGMSKKQISKQFKSIVKFADIGSFIDTHMFKYSSGMQLRLGFSIAVHSNPDILILDEGVAVGDKNFRVKAKKKITSLFKQKKTIIIASHWIEFLKNNCDRVIHLDKGKVINDGDLSILEKYEQKYRRTRTR